jgi:nickel/cobalt transporter (NicO) family protein
MITKPKLPRLAITLCLPIFLMSLANPAGFAHPLGNFTVNHFSRLQISNDRISIRFIVDMAEIPAFQTLQKLDTDNDGKPSAEELKAYAEQQAGRYAEGLRLTVDDLQVRVQPSAQTVTTPEGTGGLPTLRIEYDFVANLRTSGTTHRVIYEDTNENERLGWHEIAIAPISNITVFNSSAYANTVSDELKAYPEDLLAAPLNERKAEFSFTPGAMPANANALLTREGRPVAPARDRFAELIAVPELTLPVALLGLLIAAFLGGVHAMSPGHGKTVVGAYLVGSRGTPKHAIFLGLTVTITHTLGVFALGLVTLFASQYVVPEKLFPVIGLLSGLIVFGLGLSLFIKRLRVALGFAAADHHHEHDHSRGHLHTHDHGDGHPHSHEHGEHSPHDQEHSHDHGHGHQNGHTHSHAPEAVRAHGHHPHQPQFAMAAHTDEPHTHSPEDGTAHTHHESGHSHSGDAAGQPFVHSHDGGKPHSHLPPGADGSAITWKSLLALGISGGLLPCPSALVVLLSAISLQRIGYGLLLVVAFSAGLAATLTGVGLMFLYAGRLLKRPASVRNHALTRVLPVLSALVIACVGALICYEAFITGGFK